MTEVQLPYFPAPTGLRERVRSAVRRDRRRRSWRIGVTAGLTASLVLLAGAWGIRAAGGGADPGFAAALDGHLRSLAPGHLTDVASTDRHTVKPWFAGRLDFSPPVVDPAAAGFPLLGGRVDVLDGTPVAALVYSRRSHLINVFVRPAAAQETTTPRATVLRGINILTWSDGAMRFWAVSDLNLAELEQLRGLVTTPHPDVIVP